MLNRYISNIGIIPTVMMVQVLYKAWLNAVIDNKQVADNAQIIISQTEIDAKYAIKSQFGEHQKVKRRNTFHESNLPFPDQKLQEAEHECMQTAKA